MTTDGGVEVKDSFLLLRNREYVAVEIKSGRVFSEKWCKGLRAIAELKGQQRRIVVYPRGPVMRTEVSIDLMLMATLPVCWPKIDYYLNRV